MEQADYRDERTSYLSIIKHSLGRLTLGQMDSFARHVQVECERTVKKFERDQFKLGIAQDRKTCGMYIMQHMGRIPNFELSILAGAMLKEIEGNELYGVYQRDNWKEES